MVEEIEESINIYDDDNFTCKTYDYEDTAYEHAQEQDDIKDTRKIRDKLMEYQKIQHEKFNNKSKNIIKFSIIQGIITVLCAIFLADSDNSIHLILLLVSVISIILQFIFVGFIWKWTLFTNPYRKNVNIRRGPWY